MCLRGVWLTPVAAVNRRCRADIFRALQMGAPNGTPVAARCSARGRRRSLLPAGNSLPQDAVTDLHHGVQL